MLELRDLSVENDLDSYNTGNPSWPGALFHRERARSTPPDVGATMVGVFACTWGAPPRGQRRVQSAARAVAARPGIPRLVTQNMDSNAHILKANDLLGFRRVHAYVDVQIDGAPLPSSTSAALDQPG